MKANAISTIMIKTISFLVLGFALSVNAQDWPVWRATGSHSAFVAQGLPESLTLQWSRDLGKPDPAFDYHFRLCADPSYEPVAANGLLFVPSNVSDDVTAYDLATGAEKWRFISQGPVRFAPVASRNRVWFVSDDGYLYCLEAETGKLVWKVRGAPDDRADFRMLVNGRMCFRWPARGGPLLKNGVLYFGCGLWPSEGVFALAVNAESGKIIWRNNEISQIDDGLEEHGKMADIGLPPHGYFTEAGNRIAMPSGRAFAAFLDPATGKLDPYNSFYAKHYPVPRGAWAVVGGGDFWWQGGALFAVSGKVLDSLPAGPLTIKETAEICGQDIAWVEKEIKAGTITETKVKGERRVMISPRSSAMAFALESRHKTPNAGQKYELENRPVVSMPEIATRHEVDARALPVFTGSLMIRSEFAKPKDNEIERGVTHFRPPEGDVIRAYKLSESSWTILSVTGKIKSGNSGLRRQLEFKTAWELKSPLIAKIVAGDRLYAAGENKIAAITIPAAGGKPAIAWEAKVDGFPVGVIAANGYLIVTTDKGHLCSFGGNATTTAAALSRPQKALAAEDEWKSTVADLKHGLNADGGYALVIGWNSGALARELAQQTSLTVIVAEPDPLMADQARFDLASTGISARRVQVIAGESDKLRLPPYFAELVVSEDFTSLDDGGRVWTQAALDVLRPFTGAARLPLRPKQLEKAQAHAATLGGFEFASNGRWSTVRRVAMPKGADEWTHEAANAGNTFASADRLAVPPFGLLWYSGGIDRDFSPEFEYHHNRNPYPTLSAGRLFLLASNDIHAIDAWTGRHLWKTSLPVSDKTKSRLGDHRTFSRPTDQNLIATPDSVYVFRENEAVRLDAATGKQLASLTVSGGAHWDEARIAGGTLFIAAGNRLIALDRITGKVRWEHQAPAENVAFALDSERVFSVGYSAERSRSAAAAEPAATTLRVLRASDGSQLWNAPVEIPQRPGQSEKSVGKPKWSGVFAENPLKPVIITGANGVTLAILDRHRFFAFESATGKQLWNYSSKNSLSDLVRFEPPTLTRDFVVCDGGTVLESRTGKPATHAEVGGRGTGCNRFIGSDALLTFRSALACVYDLKTGKRTYLSSIRSGCTNGMLPAGGILNAPNTAHGCVCNYPFLTSYALMNLPEAAKWAPANPPDVQFSSDRGAD